MPLGSLASISISESNDTRRKSARVAFHGFLKRVFRRHDRSGREQAYLLQKDDIGIRLADGHGDVDEIDMLVTRMYRQRGYLIPTASAGGSRDSFRRVTLEACHRNQTVGTLTVNLDSNGLNAEDLYPEEIRRYRENGARLCEFNRLALDIEDCSKNALACLFHLGFIFAFHIYGATDLFIEVNPRHAAFYRRQLGFRMVGAEKLCRRVNAPAVLLHKRLAVLAEELLRLGGLRIPQNKPIYALSLPPWEERALLVTIRRMLAETA